MLSSMLHGASATRSSAALVLAALLSAACGGGGGGPDGATDSASAGGDSGSDSASASGDSAAAQPFGEEHAGQYDLGPVEWTGSFNNACSPYPSAVQGIEGALLAGLSNEVAGTGSLCDACVQVQTARGRTATLRVVTYGQTRAPGNMDVSQAAYNLLNLGENPRSMRWRLVRCPTSEPVYFQFQTGANPWWTSFWVRNPSVAVDYVEVRSANHASFFRLRRGNDGTFNDDGGFGMGAFTLRVVGLDGTRTEQSFPSFEAGALVRGTANLQ